MNIQKAVSTLIVALFTAASIQSVAFAKAKDDDSVRSWGRWATLVQPAAGPQVANIALAGLGLPFVELIPDTPEPPPVAAGSCDAGAACGYAVISQERFQVSFDLADNNLQEITTTHGPQLATPNLDPIPEFRVPEQGDGPFVLNIEGPEQDSVPITLTVDSNSTSVSLDPTNYNVSILPVFPGVTIWGNGDDGLEIFGLSVDVLGKLVAGGFVFSEVNAPEAPFFVDEKSIEAAFFVGETSSLDDLAIAELNAGNVVANYSGFTFLSGTFVDIDVDFGEGTFIATVNDGIDGSISEQLNTDGSTSLIGEVGFVASGDINGVNIVANNISAADADAISGDFIGSFFGGEAAVLAGSIDIDKTTEAVDGNYSDIYATVDTSSEVIPSPE